MEDTSYVATVENQITKPDCVFLWPDLWAAEVADRRARLDEEEPDFLCIGCGVSTARDGVSEYYMLEDDVWGLVNPAFDGMLCIGCVEQRLGRCLTPDDFALVPLNFMREFQSERLRSRITPIGKGAA